MECSDIRIIASHTMDLLLLHGALGTWKQLSVLSKVLLVIPTRTLEFCFHGERAIPEEGLTMEVFLRDIREAMQEAG